MEDVYTGLPAAFGIEEVLSAPAEATALAALIRTNVRPVPEKASRLGPVYRYDDNDCGGEHELSFHAFKLKGLPGVTFVWRCVKIKPTKHVLVDGV